MPWLNIIFALILKHNSQNFRALAYNEFKYSLGAKVPEPVRRSEAEADRREHPEGMHIIIPQKQR
jgi:hypothetical protein